MKGTGIKEIILDNIAIPLRYIPSFVGAIGFGMVLLKILRDNPSFRRRLKELKGRVFLFDARDAGQRFYLIIEDGDIKVLPHFGRKADVTMRGEVKVLFKVFMGEEDPDTVFFSRRLEISGDTGVAVHFKNILAGTLQ